MFTSGQHSGWRFLWLVLLMALQVATRLCVLPVALLLAQPFVCREYVCGGRVGFAQSPCSLVCMVVLLLRSGVSGTWVVEADPAVECFSDSTHWAYVSLVTVRACMPMSWLSQAHGAMTPAMW